MLVDVTIASRKSPAGFTQQVEFTTFEELKTKVDQMVEDCEFYRVTVEIVPIDFEPTPEQKTIIRKIEEE